MATASPARATAINRPASVALIVLAALACVTAVTVNPRQALLLIVAAGLGVALYHGSLGFTAYWRRWLVTGDARGVRIQLWIVAVGSLAFFPLIGGWVPGVDAWGAVAPLGLDLVIGAFLFGLGMQLANGCGSGTLFTLGGGSTKMLFTLAAFIVGSLVATFHLHLWRELPELPAVSLINEFGVGGGLAVQAGLIGLLVLATGFRQGRARAREQPTRSFLRGPWPAYAAATALAILAVIVLVIQGHPWGVTWAFAIWGGKIYDTFGGDLTGVPFWSADWTQTALHQSVLTNVTSITNFGVILGALVAAGLAGRFAPVWSIPWRPAVAALIGGLAMGYGARLAYGCNIGAFIGGTMSGSLHGWLWIAAALPGCWLGIRLRPTFGLLNEPSAR